jgi:CBS domain-containing protein
MKITEVHVEKFLEPIDSISENATVTELVTKMKSYKTTFMPVVNSEGKLIGCVFDYNLIKIVKQESVSPLAGSVWSDTVDNVLANKQVKEIMETKFVKVHPEDTIDSALKVMNSNDARVLTVTDREGKFMGVLRIRTIFDRLFKELIGE